MQNNVYLSLMKGVNHISLLSTFTSIDDQGIFKIIEQTNKGIAYQVFFSLTEKMPFSLVQWASILRISRRTMERIRDEKKAIEPPYAEQVIRVVMLYNYGVTVFGSAKKFNQWLTLPSLPLGNITPQTLLNNSYGVEAVKNELGRIEHGIFA